VARQHPDVDVSSYPRFDGADHRIKVTFESKDRAHAQATTRAYLAALPPGALVRWEGL